MFSTLKVQRSQKIRIGATRRNLQAQPKTLKKITEHLIYQPKRKIFQKKYVKFLQSEKKLKIRMGLPDEILAGSPKNNRTQVNFRKP
jgi:capsid portal protein